MCMKEFFVFFQFMKSLFDNKWYSQFHWYQIIHTYVDFHEKKRGQMNLNALIWQFILYNNKGYKNDFAK